MVRPRDFAWHRHLPAADQADSREGVVGGATGAHGDQGGVIAAAAGGAREAGSVNGFGYEFPDDADSRGWLCPSRREMSTWESHPCGGGTLSHVASPITAGEGEQTCQITAVRKPSERSLSRWMVSIGQGARRTMCSATLPRTR